ncbi:MAG TPA: GNAT family N-acetyltransferase [Vicinamibacteria bacterium]|jgi:ribosomal protein S18 acetylase RimI-like enzyme|nr:GNAT family N-acetyltransferase [Vicinamibacteria bacterium]
MKETTPRPASRAGAPTTFRLARREDRTFVRELALRVFTVYGSYDRYLVEWFDTEGVVTFLAEIDETLVGMMMLMAYPNPAKRTEAIADLLAIAVDPDFQSQGIGTELLQKAIKEAPLLDASIPIRELHLSVAGNNPRAQSLFSRHGFRYSCDEGIYPAGQRALHMTRPL